MSVLGSLDAIALKAQTNMTGLKKCYSATGGGISSAIRPIPQGIDDGPVGVVWLGSGSGTSGNVEAFVCEMRLDIWVQAENAAYAYKTLAAYPDIAMTTFRSDMDLGSQAARCQLSGWDEPESETVNGRYYLVLPLRLETLIYRQGADATA
jgi:hypothetical protein